MSVHPPDQGRASEIVPRWEWRTFDDHLADDGALAFLRAVPAAQSDETYLLSHATDASAKIRSDVMDTKVLRRVSATGLQLWVPTMKAPFPLDEAALAEVAAVLAVPLAASAAGRPTRSELLDELVAARGDLRVAQVRKRRRRSLLDDCMIELTDMTVDGRTAWSVAVESPDPDLVLRTIDTLGLTGRPNTSVAAGLKALLSWQPSRFAVIDVGTNSVKFLLGERLPDGGIRTLSETAVVTRLGEGLTGSGELADVAIARTVDAIDGLVAEAHREGPVSVVAVGTAGLRQAPNRDTLLQAVHERSNVQVEVISGVDEARLAHRAALWELHLVGERLLVFDSGGGSSQFTIGTATRIEQQFSIDVGAVAVTERFGLAGSVSRETVEDAVAAVDEHLDRLRAAAAPDMVIAIGGTSTNLAAHMHGLERYDPDVVHGTVITLAEVDRQIEIFRGLSADGRRGLPGLQPARAEVILGGACIVRAILAATGQQQMTVSDRGLRHGVAAERFGPV